MLRMRFIEIARPRHLHLNGMPTLSGPTVVAGDVPPLKPTVGDMAEPSLLVKHLDTTLAKGGRATQAVDRSQIQIGQAAFE